jgi:hypothetical protein
MQKIDDCKEIRLALTRAGIATCPEKCLQTFRLVVTAQYIYHTFLNIVICRCLDAKSSCINKEASYSLIKLLLLSI